MKFSVLFWEVIFGRGAPCYTSAIIKYVKLFHDGGRYDINNFALQINGLFST